MLLMLQNALGTLVVVVIYALGYRYIAKPIIEKILGRKLK